MRPLLCEIHAHTTFSDGELRPSELVDLYGFAGFDVLVITDHVCRSEGRSSSVGAGDYRYYLQTIEAEAERARRVYGLLVIPGLELTWEDRPERSAHALALGLRDWIGLDEGLDQALLTADAAGAALIGAHPYTLAATTNATRTTARFSEDRDWARETLHRFELCNRHEFFAWVAEEAAARRGERRLPPARAPLDLEDAAALRQGGGRGRRVPPLARRGDADPARRGRPGPP
jgi:hypothetical protein